MRGNKVHHDKADGWNTLFRYLMNENETEYLVKLDKYKDEKDRKFFLKRYYEKGYKMGSSALFISLRRSLQQGVYASLMVNLHFSGATNGSESINITRQYSVLHFSLTAQVCFYLFLIPETVQLIQFCHLYYSVSRSMWECTIRLTKG